MYLPLLARDGVDDGIPNPRGKSLANLSIVFACLSFAFVSARLTTRFVVHRKFGPDDYLIVVALILAICMAVSFNEEVVNGFGLHKTQVSKPHLIEALKWFFAAQLLYKVAICIIKLSILFFYLRIFPSKRFRISAYVVGGIVVAYSIASICATIWQCHPIEKTWNKALPGHCIDIGDVWYSTSVMAIVTDLMIIALPIFQIRKLQLPLSQKIGLSIMFSLGCFIIACTVVRMATVGPAVTQVDTPYYQASSNSWTFLEVNVAIICANLPDLKGPIFKLMPCLGRNKTQNGSNAYSNNFSRDNYNSKNIISSSAGSPREMHDNASDEEFILHDVSGVKKTMDVNVTYDDAMSGIEKLDNKNNLRREYLPH